MNIFYSTGQVIPCYVYIHLQLLNAAILKWNLKHVINFWNLTFVFLRFVFQSAKSNKQTAAKWTSGGALSDFPPFSTTFGLTPRVTPFPHISETQAGWLQQREQFFESSRRKKSGRREGGLRRGRGPVWTKLSGDHPDEPSSRRPRGPPSSSRPRLPAIDLPPKWRRWNIAHHRVGWEQWHLT